MSAIVETDKLTRHFGKLVAVDSVDFQVDKGELHSVIGPNGAGKTTLFNLLTGNLTPTSGNVFYKGDDITGLQPHEITKAGISRSYQITNVFEDISVHDNVWVGTQWNKRKHLNPVLPRERFTEVEDDTKEILERVGLSPHRDKEAESLAHGERRRLDIAIALGTDPDLLLLDEPTSGLSPEETENITELIVELNEEYTIILIEHNIDIVMNISDRISVLHDGELIKTDIPSVVQGSEQVQAAYLGTEHGA